MKKAFQNGPLDEARASGIPDMNMSSREKAFQYLFSYQNTDGGWGAAQGEESTILLTAMTLQSLKQYPESPQKTAAVNNAVSYLSSEQNDDGGFGQRISTPQETALVCSALQGLVDDSSILARARDFLSGCQSFNGSWNDDVYSTILAIEALGVFWDTGSALGDTGLTQTGDEKDQEDVTHESQSVTDKSQPASEFQLAVRDGAVSGAGDEGLSAPKSEVREKTHHTKISLVSRRKASSSAAESADTPTPKSVAIQSVNTDKKKYSSNETVYIYSTIDNRSDTVVSVVVNAQIADSYGHIVDAASHDTTPSVNLGAGACEPVTLSWHTGMNPPGMYSVRFHVADAADGRILDERKVALAITPAIVIDEMSVLVEPDRCSANETETIDCRIAFQNRSNTDAPLKAEWALKDPEGNIVHQDSLEFELPVSVPDAVMELNSFTCNFNKCGHYAIEAVVYAGDVVCAGARSTINVNPAIRIEATRSLDPSIVTPDGEKTIKVGIRLEGVGMTANPSIVHAQTNTVGDMISITFDKAMADPTGNELKIAVTADKVLVSARDVCLDIPDITTFNLYLDKPVVRGQEIYISCSSADLTCIEGKPVMPFHNEPVANKVSPPIFNQDGYGFSGLIPPKPLAQKTIMTGYSQWPAGFRKGNLAFTGAVFDGECVWMVPANAHSVVRIDKNTGEMTACSEWPEGFRKGNLAFTGAVFDGRFIWLIPANADSVIKIDKKNGKMVSYSKWPEGFSKGGHAFAGGVFDGASIWMIPSYADSVVRVDITNGHMTSYNQWPEGFAKGGYAFAGGVFDGRFIWMIPANADSVVTLDTLTGEMARYNNWPEGHSIVEYAFAGGVFDGRYIWMVPYYSEQVVRIDSKTGQMTGHHRRPEELGKVEYAFAGAVFDGQAIWMVPLNADRVIKIDKETSEVTELTDWPQGFHKGVNAFAGGVFDGECIWMVPSYADRVLKICSYSSLSVTANITANDSFYLYVSQDESEEGTLVGKGQGWASIHSINASLVPGVTNYLHVKCVDKKGPIAAFIADFTLNDPNFHFTDGTQKIVTSEDSWRVYLNKFGGVLGSVVSIGKNGLGSWSTRFGIDLEASWIWTQRGTDKGTRYFSTPIYYSAVPITPMEDIHVTSVVGGPDVVIDEASFTRKPSRFEKKGDTTVAEWRLKSFRVGQREDVYFNATMLDPVPEEDRIINGSLEMSYKDASGTEVSRGFGPVHVHVLPSSFISFVNVADNTFTVGDNVNIGCSFKNLGATEKTVLLVAVIEDADGAVIQQFSQKDIAFPPGEEKKIDNISLNLMSAIPGSHRARVILSDNDRQLAEASCEFTVISPAIEDTHSAPAQEVQEVHREGLKEEGAVTAPDDLAEVSTGNLSSQNLEATITAQPSPIYQGLSETIYYKISPGEKNDLAGIKVEVAILTVDSRETKQTFTPQVPNAKDGSYSGAFTFSTGKLEPGEYIVSLLVSSDTIVEPREIASTQFAVRRIDVVVT